MQILANKKQASNRTVTISDFHYTIMVAIFLNWKLPLGSMCVRMSLYVSMSYQSIVLRYQNEAVVVNEVAVNVLLNRKQSVYKQL